MKKEKVFYYNSETDSVTKFKEKGINIDGKYKYIIKNPLIKFISFFSYNFLATPFAYITFKLIKNIKFHNTKILKSYKKGGYFIYANHTNHYADGFCPRLICFAKKPHIIVHSSNVSIPFLGKFTKMWGALPLPDNLEATKNFYKAIEHTLNKNNPILIYPEANLWPYYTKIRNFSTTSFRYPIKFDKPSFTFTTIYKKRKTRNAPKIEIYVDGPFFPDKTLNEKEAQSNLKDKIYSTLCARASLSNYEYVKYIKRSNHD